MIKLRVVLVESDGATWVVGLRPDAPLNRSTTFLPPREWTLTLIDTPTSHYQAISAIWTPEGDSNPAGTLAVTFQRPSGDGDCRLDLPAQTMIAGFNGGLIAPLVTEISLQ